MATSTTELIMRFTGDPRHLQQTLAQVRADLSRLNQQQVANVRQTNTQTATEASHAEQRRLADSIRAANARLREEQRTAREVSRIVAETARQAAAQERIRERAAKQLADARIREGKRAAKELEKSLGGGSTGGTIFDIAGGLSSVPNLGRIGSLASQLSSVTAASGAAGSATAALAGPIGIAVAAFAAEAAVVVAVTKGLVDLAKRTAEFEGNLFDMSQQLGISVETLSTLQVLATTTGGSIETVAGSLAIFQRNLEAAQDPTGKEAQLLEELGVVATDTESALDQTLAGLFALGEGARQTDATLELFGRSGRFVLAILKESQGDLEKAKQRFRELGIEVSTGNAVAADKFNDSLAELQFQMRATEAIVGRDLIPALTEIVRTTGELVTAIRPVITLFGTTVGITARAASASYKGLSLVISALTGDYQALTRAIKESKDAQNIPVVEIPALVPAPLPGAPSRQQTASEAAINADVVLADAKRKAAEANQALASLFEQGRRTRQQVANETIGLNKKVLDAEIQRIETQIQLRQADLKALEESAKEHGRIIKQDSDEYRAATAAITKLQQERLDKENEFRVSSGAIRAKAAKESADARRSEEQNKTDIEIKEFDRQIKNTEAAIARGAQAESEGLTIIEALERAKIDARIAGLEEQKRIGFLTVQEQENLNEQIKTLNQEADRLQDEQRNRRLQKDLESAQRSRDIKLGEIETALELQRIVGERAIATTQAQADLRIKSEEEAARKILQIKLDLIDQEIQATEAKLKAAASIANVGERARVEAELNSQLRILAEERITIQTEGDRAIDEGRKRDLENERRYADELKRIKQQTLAVEMDAAREAIRLMEIHFANRRDIIRAQLQFDIEAERQRHRQAEETLRNLEQENRESQKTVAEKLEFEQGINRLREAEAERHRQAMRGIRAQATQDEDEASPLGRIGLDVANLEEFASVIEDSIVPLSQILTNAFMQVADAIGQTVQNWVLLGETGPAVMRKIVAQALASIAAEAAVNAIKELALGFATLFFNPAESAAHFTAAGLWAAIAGVSAIAGRAVAGNLFKKPEDDTGRRGGGGGSSTRGERDPIDLVRNRQQQELHIFLHGEPGPRFRDAVFSSVVDDVRSNGPMRTVFKEVAEG